LSILLDLSGLSVVFISYDEPNAHHNFEVLRAVVPAVLSVHGITGFDRAHRQAGDSASTAHVITVDGDNLLQEPDFFTRRLRFTPQELNSVVSFSARLPHNGLVYGNGGIKIWPRPLLRSLRTHEASQKKSQSIDFAWTIPYVQAGGAPSDSVVTTTSFQAYRAGLREGVRLTTQQGKTAAQKFPQLSPAKAMQTHLAKSVIERLAIWCSVGCDVENGSFAILGARMGCVMAMLEGFEVEKISDFDWIAKFWEDRVVPATGDADGLTRIISDYGDRIVSELGLRVEKLSPMASKFVKSIYRPPRRLGTLLPQ